MGWDEICEKHRKLVDSEFISCDGLAERQNFRLLVREEFPGLSGPRIDEAMDFCCASMRLPRLRREFIQCLRRQLEGARRESGL